MREILRVCGIFTKKLKRFNGPFKSRRGSHYFWILEKRDANSSPMNRFPRSYERGTLTTLMQIQEQYFKNLITDQKVKIFHERM